MEYTFQKPDFRAREVVVIDYTPKKTKYAAEVPAERMKFRMHEDLKTLRYAEDDFENIYQFQRWRLHQIFRGVVKDPHLSSQWDTRKMKTTQKQFKVVKKGSVDEDVTLTEALNHPWFYDLCNEILDSKLWGFSLIEFGPVVNGAPQDYRNERGRWFPAINQIDRDYVKPEFNCIIHEYGEITGLDFDDPRVKNTLLFVGQRHDAGILMKVVKWILFKDNLAANWSEWAELFGMDMRIGKTNAEGDDKKHFLRTLRDIGAAGYGVIDKDDDLEYIGSNKADAFQVYQKFIEYIDSQVSKKIFGQDVITNNTGQVVGKVGENVSNLYGDMDARYVSSVVNERLLPRFTALGIGNFDGYVFMYDTTEKLSIIERADQDVKIVEMGYRPKKDYIEKTYGTEVEDQIIERVAPKPPKPNKNEQV